MTETPIMHTKDSSELQDKKEFLTLKNGLDTTGPKCFLCNKEFSESYAEIEINSSVSLCLHYGCDEIAFRLFDVFFDKSLKYYLENGLSDLFKEEGMIKSVEL